MPKSHHYHKVRPAVGEFQAFEQLRAQNQSALLQWCHNTWPPTHDKEAFSIPPQLQYYEKNRNFGVSHTWFGSPTLPFTNCVIWDSLLNLSESAFTFSKWRISPISWIGYDYRMGNASFFLFFVFVFCFLKRLMQCLTHNKCFSLRDSGIHGAQKTHLEKNDQSSVQQNILRIHVFNAILD